MRRFMLAVVLLAGVAGLAACKIEDPGAGQNVAQRGKVIQDPGQAGAPQVNGQPMTGFQGTPGPMPTVDPTVSATFQELNRLSVGMLYLQESSHPLTRDQAAMLLPYWENIQAAMQPQEGEGQPGGPDQPPDGKGTLGPDGTPQQPSQGGGQGQGGRRGFMMLMDISRISGDLASIRAALTQEQVSEINALTQDQMNMTLQKYGISVGFSGQGGRPNRPGGPDQGTPGMIIVEGTMPPPSTPDATELATIQARRGSGPMVRGNPVIDEVIRMLKELAGK